ncbi:hypothetical protein DPX16_7083 [Anabarilius grahami]|uniref:Uncharacterized protein n=1 Tax=Anabarilius grahami TaxID=495550 RepID=A0A3N0XJE2_ANAGA|nr:hypothetical protein DPX16_7083 [Anabarilius grahami]
MDPDPEPTPTADNEPEPTTNPERGPEPMPAMEPHPAALSVPETNLPPSLTSEAEKEPEPEPATWVFLESTQAAQSISEPGADLCLIDLWSTDPVPSRIPTLVSSSSPLVSSGYLDAPFPSGNLPPPMCLPNFLVPSPPLIKSSPLDASAPLVSSSSSALSPLLTPCSPSDSLRVSRSPAQFLFPALFSFWFLGF